MNKQAPTDKSPLNNEASLKAVLFQFLKLYERWSEDRQVFIASLAQHEEKVKIFSEQLAQLKQLEPEVRQQLVKSIADASQRMAEQVGEKVSESAVQAIETVVKNLERVTYQAATQLDTYQLHFKAQQWKLIATTVGTTLVASLLMVWLLLPRAIIPLTPDALRTYNNGAFIEKVWPQLSPTVREKINAAGQTKDTPE